MHSHAGAWEREISVVVCSVPEKITEGAVLKTDKRPQLYHAFSCKLIRREVIKGAHHLNLSAGWLQCVLFLDEVEFHPAVTLAAVVGPVLICWVPFTPADGAHQVGWDTDIPEVFTHYKGAFG